MDSAITIVFQLAILIFSVVIHEVSHGLAAHALGDSTAKYAGRLTLNPLKHLDPFGSVLFPLLTYLATGGGFVFGWAKPVPYNPYNLKVRNQDVGSAIVGAAGPLSNFFTAGIFGVVSVLLPLSHSIREMLSIRFLQSLFSGHSPLALGTTSLETFYLTALYIVWINLVLAIFNLVPIPPLDGSKVLFSLLPYDWFGFRMFLERFGLLLLLIFIFYFSQWILPIVSFLFRFFTGSSVSF